MNRNILASGVAMTFLFGEAPAATLVLDSFTEGEHMLVAGVASATSAAINSAFGSKRVTSITRFVPQGTTVTSTLVQPGGSVEFHAAGTSITSDRPLEMRLHYADGGPFSLAGYSAFEFDFAVIAGSGNLIIELGSETSIYGPEINRIPVNTAGTVTVPLSALNFGPTGSIESFYAMHITFEAVSEEYVLTLDEIRVIPEPSSLVLLAASSIGVLVRRRRNG